MRSQRPPRQIQEQAHDTNAIGNGRKYWSKGGDRGGLGKGSTKDSGKGAYKGWGRGGKGDGKGGKRINNVDNNGTCVYLWDLEFVQEDPLADAELHPPSLRWITLFTRDGSEIMSTLLYYHVGRTVVLR